jgi:hypothetical protein
MMGAKPTTGEPTAEVNWERALLWERTTFCKRELEHINGTAIVLHTMAHTGVPQSRKLIIMTNTSRYKIATPTLKNSGFGGLVVSMLASGTQDRGFAPGQSRQIFSGEKILSMPSFGREVKPFAPCRRFAACQRTI